MDAVKLGSTATSLEILETLSAMEEATPSELAGELQKPVSTVHDHLATMRVKGYVTERAGAYRLGLSLLSLGSSARQARPIFDIGKPIAIELAKEMNAAAGIIVEEDGRATILFLYNDNENIQSNAFPGQSLPLHATASGKTILAFSDEEKRERLIQNIDFEPHTSHTIRSESKLRNELEEIRERGIAFNLQEFHHAIGAAAPIMIEERLEGILAVTAPHRRVDLDQFRADVEEMMFEMATVVEMNLHKAM